MDTARFLPNSKARSSDQKLIMLFRGDFRARSIKDGFQIQDFEDDTGSGGIYLTDNSDIASEYATKKEFYEEDSCEAQKHILIKANGTKEIPLMSAECHINDNCKHKITQTVLSLNSDHEFTGGDTIISKFTWEDYLKRNRGRYIKTCVDVLFHSGMLNADEFLEFWKATDAFQKVHYDNPYEAESVVTPVYLDIQNPIDTSNIPDGLINLAKLKIGSDDLTIQMFETLQKYGNDSDNISVVTKPFRECMMQLGYDGIQDRGGQVTGGISHNVWIAFSEDQITPAYSPEAVSYRKDFDNDLSCANLPGPR